jgi:Raf kinase inhibitor-like YbhB/YbcL family protein
VKKLAILFVPIFTIVSLVLVSFACGTQETLTPTMEGGDSMALMLKSTAFVAGESIPYKYTCDGADVSPPLEWSNIPRDTASFALVADDPDAPGGTWVHWVLYNIPSEKRSLSEALQAQAEFPDGSKHGKNSAGRLGYNGPCPPSGNHRYFFKLYALDNVLNLGPGASKEQLLSAMKGHILEQAELMGKYKR